MSITWEMARLLSRWHELPDKEIGRVTQDMRKVSSGCFLVLFIVVTCAVSFDLPLSLSHILSHIDARPRQCRT